MNNTKTTKRALLSSVIAMLLCVTMLIGTTFAWFTDSASTAVNKIQAGTLDIGLEMKKTDGTWANAEGETLGWVAKDGRAQNNIFWEPGCTYQLPTLKITNKGNLALQFKVLINGISGDMELLNALEFTYAFNWMAEDNYRIDSGDFEGSAMRTIPYEIPLDEDAVAEYMFGNADADFVKGYLLTPDNPAYGYPMNVGYYTLQAHMKEEAGNEYQGKALENISITVVATQVAGIEMDSFDDLYDKDATYPVINAMVLSDPATKAEVMKEDPEDPDVGLHPVFEGKTYSVPGKTLVTADETFNRIDFVNANVTCDTLINVTSNNTVMISDCSITLPDGGKLVVSTDPTVQVLIVGNVTVNGVKLTRENCGMGTELYNQYFQGIGTCFFY